MRRKIFQAISTVISDIIFSEIILNAGIIINKLTLVKRSRVRLMKKKGGRSNVQLNV